MPSIFIDESRAKQMKNKEILKTNIQTGKELIESVTNPEVKKGMKEALSQLQSSLEKVQRQEKGLKKVFSDSIKREDWFFQSSLSIYLRLNSLSICCEICPLTVLITSLI